MKQASPGKAGLQYEVRGKVVSSFAIWRFLNGKLLVLSRNSEGAVLGSD